MADTKATGQTVTLNIFEAQLHQGALDDRINRFARDYAPGDRQLAADFHMQLHQIVRLTYAVAQAPLLAEHRKLMETMATSTLLVPRTT